MSISVLIRMIMYVGMAGGVIFAWNSRRKQKSKVKNTIAPTPAADIQPDDSASLTDAQWQKRLAAVEAIAEKQDVDRIPDLAPLLNDDDSDVREAVVKTLVDFGKPSVPVLLDVLASGRLEGREAAARALGQIAHASAVKGLISALEDESEWVRQPVVDALGRIGGKEAVDALKKALKDTSNDVQKKAKSALSMLGAA